MFFVLDGIELEFAEPPDAWCKAEAQQIAERKNVISKAFGIGSMLMNIELGVMVQQAVEHVGCFTNLRRNYLCEKGRMLVRDMGVKGNTRFFTIVGIV